MKERPLVSIFHVVTVESKEHEGFWEAHCTAQDGTEFSGLARDKYLAASFVYDKVANWHREQSKKLREEKANAQ